VKISVDAAPLKKKDAGLWIFHGFERILFSGFRISISRLENQIVYFLRDIGPFDFKQLSQQMSMLAVNSDS